MRALSGYCPECRHPLQNDGHERNLRAPDAVPKCDYGYVGAYLDMKAPAACGCTYPTDPPSDK